MRSALYVIFAPINSQLILSGHIAGLQHSYLDHPTDNYDVSGGVCKLGHCGDVSRMSLRTDGNIDSM